MYLSPLFSKYTVFIYDICFSICSFTSANKTPTQKGHKPKMKYFALIALFFFLTLSITSADITSPIRPIADAHLNSNASNTNYGSSPVGYYNRQTTTPYADFYILTMFNVSLLPSTVTQANITYVQDGVCQDEIAGPYFVVDAYRTVTNWTEGAVTWNSRPTETSKFLTDFADGDEYTLTIDVTEVVLDAKSTGTQLISVLIKGRSILPIVPVHMRETPLEEDKPFLRARYNPV
jgi:hypothetical protein